MLEFEELSFREAVTYTNKITTIPLEDQGAVYIGGVNGAGKAQPLYSRIKIPGGWKQMGDMKIGDVVCTPDGKTANAVGVFPQGLRPTYRITFEDGRTVDCDENHLWKVYCHAWRYRRQQGKKGLSDHAYRVLSLKDILKRRRTRKGDVFVPLCQPTFNENANLPIDPYVLGLLLGDGGSTRSVTFTNVDSENIANLQARLKEGYYLKVVSKKKNCCCYRIVSKPECRQGNKGRSGVFNYYVKALRDLKLYGKPGWEKFIPDIYKEASVEQRLELLRGLMDTDGEVDKAKCTVTKYKGHPSGGSVSYATSSHRLALDVQYLVRSLGGLCKIRIRKTYYRTKQGIRKRCRTCFKCSIRHSNPEMLIRLSRKRERAVRSHSTTLRCKIKDIRYLGMKKTQCIALDSDDSLYITDGFAVTHNSLPFNVLYNVLFGHTPLSSKGKRKLIANPGYYAHVKFRLNGVPYEVRQFFDNPEFEYEGYDILRDGCSLKIGGGIPEAEKTIARLLPFTPEEFSSFYYLAQDSLHVLAYGKGSERLDYLSKVFGFDIYDQVRAKLKIRLDEVDRQLADIAKAQENVDRLEEHLKKYPSLELLEKRLEVCRFHLEESREQRNKLQHLKSDIEGKTATYKTRRNLEESIQRYGELRQLSDISEDISKWQSRQSDYQVYLNQWQQKKRLLQEFAAVEDFVKQDPATLSSQLDTLIGQKGRAVIINRQVKQRKELVSKISLLKSELTHDGAEITRLAQDSSKNLIEKRALLSQKKSEITDFKDLSKDGRVCTRCGQSLDAEHIAKELQRLGSEVSALTLAIKNLEDVDRVCKQESKFLEEILKNQSILDSIPDGVEMDVEELNGRIEELREHLAKTKDARRLQKELEAYAKYSSSKMVAISQQLPKLQFKLKKLQEEFGQSREKESLAKQLARLPMINLEEVDETRLAGVNEQLEMYDEVIPLLASDIRECTTIQTTVKDYKQQIESELKKAAKLTELAAFRRIVNTCYKAYLPANLKKIQVSKVSELIAQKLNIFVPMIFNENIQFTVDASENSVDILFKRGSQPERDVRFLNGGFKKRFLIALIPTLAGLISARKRCNLIVLDEIESNIDKLGRKAIGEFLIPFLKTKFQTVIVISPSNLTHDGSLEALIPLDHFDKLYIAKYENNSSTLERYIDA